MCNKSYSSLDNQAPALCSHCCLQYCNIGPTGPLWAHVDFILNKATSTDNVVLEINVVLDVKIKLPRPPMCRSQSPPAGTERLQQLYFMVNLFEIIYNM